MKFESDHQRMDTIWNINPMNWASNCNRASEGGESNGNKNM